MFDTVILLTGSVDATALTSVLQHYNPQLDIFAAESLPELRNFGRDLLARARLIGFATGTIVPPDILAALGYGAYNFHPGPPHYPGWAPAHFAVYDQASLFGVTAHVMFEKVDTGPIVGVKYFAVPPQTSVTWLEQSAFLALARLFWDLAQALALQCNPLAILPIGWSGTKRTQRQLQERCTIAPDIQAEDPGRRFCYVTPETAAPVQTPPLDQAFPIGLPDIHASQIAQQNYA